MSVPILTVEALRALLAKFPPEALVLIEGCDCEGWALDVMRRDPLDDDDVKYMDPGDNAYVGRPVVLIRRHVAWEVPEEAEP